MISLRMLNTNKAAFTDQTSKLLAQVLCCSCQDLLVSENSNAYNQLLNFDFLQLQIVFSNKVKVLKPEFES